MVWVRLLDNGPLSLPERNEWDDPAYVQVLPNSVWMHASAGRQVEGFLDVSHFAFVHAESFGEPDNTVVPEYPVTTTASGFVADYVSTVGNHSHEYKHPNPPGFLWRRRFEVYFPFTAKLTVFFPEGGPLHILNAASPVSARKTRCLFPSAALRYRCAAAADPGFQPPGVRGGHRHLSNNNFLRIFLWIFTRKRISRPIEAR